MKPRHQVSKAAIELIERFEGYRGKAAQLPDGRWTIGYGHTLTAREGAQVSEQDAEALLLYDLIAIAHSVNELTYTPLTQNQFDALCCFAFNVGLENFKRSSVLRRINEGSLLQAACAMEMWRKADFEGERIVVDALVRRRSAEKTLFLTPAGGWVPAPSPIVRPKVDYDAVQFIPRQTPVALNAPMTGDKAVVEREVPLGAPPVDPTGVSASLTAAAAVTSRLAEIVPEPTEAPQPPVVEDELVEEGIVEDAPAEEPAAETTPEPVAEAPPLAWSPSFDAAPDLAEAGEDEPMLEVTAIPAQPSVDIAPDALAVPPPPVAAEALPEETQSYTPFPQAPALAVVNGDVFTLTPLPEAEEPVHEDAAASFTLPVAANESAPGLFDVSAAADAENARTQAYYNEDHIRRLVEDDERALAASFDPEIEGATIEQARIVGLPWLVTALAGGALFAGGVVWGFNVDTGDSMSNAIGWGLGITGAGLFIFSAWRWLDGLGMPRLDDEDGDHQPE